MNKLTRKIKRKGYDLPSFLKKIHFGMSWYRKNEKPNGPDHEFLVSEIEKVDNADI